MIFLPESPRYLMHKGKNVEAYTVWKRIHGFDALESKIEFLGMERSVVAENEQQDIRKYVWLDSSQNHAHDGL